MLLLITFCNHGMRRIEFYIIWRGHLFAYELVALVLFFMNGMLCIYSWMSRTRRKKRMRLVLSLHLESTDLQSWQLCIMVSRELTSCCYLQSIRSCIILSQKNCMHSNAVYHVMNRTKNG